MKTRHWASLVSVAALAVLFWSDTARSCTYIVSDPRFVHLEAPVGGIWWVAGTFAIADEVELSDASGNKHLAEVVPPVLEGSLAIRVPATAVVGDVFEPPVGAVYLHEDGIEQFLTVASGDASNETGVVPAPTLDVELVETVVGYESIATIPMSPCGTDPGIWRTQYSQRPWISGDVAEGYVLDVVLQETGAVPFEDLPNSNAVPFAAREPGTFHEHIGGIPETSGAFDVNARLRRASDGATGPTLTLLASPSDEIETRTEFIGCASTGVDETDVPLVCLAAAIVAYRRGSTRRSAGRQV
jgi:hypothetical protein